MIAVMAPSAQQHRIAIAIALAGLLALLLAALGPTPAGGAPASTAEPSKTSFKRAKLRVVKTNLGKVVTDNAGYAQYIFSRDRPKRKRSSRCYGQCARDWPPLLTVRKPKARGAAKQRLIGTTKRRDGTKQVTYRGRPLYYYAHEPRPAFVGCHDVFLNGGDWYAIRANGKRLP